MSEVSDPFDDVVGEFVDGLTDKEELALSPESHDRLIRLSRFRQATAEERLAELQRRTSGRRGAGRRGTWNETMCRIARTGGAKTS